MKTIFYEEVRESKDSSLEALLQKTRRSSAAVYLGTLTLIAPPEDPKSPLEESLDLGP